MKLTIPSLFILIIFHLWSCNTNSNSGIKVPLDLPSHFPTPIQPPERNKTTAAGITLGKKLFFDEELSRSKTISCATCHKPEFAFADQLQFNSGHDGSQLKRNTPPLFNSAWSENFFWDGGVKNLESLSFAALMNPSEMGTDLNQICKTLNNDSDYKKLFNEAFQIDSISSAYISRALAQYIRTLISADSKYDSVKLNLTAFTNKESKGYKVFKTKCSQCHAPPLFTDNRFHDNGLDLNYSQEDLAISTGRFRITYDSMDLGKFKTPSLRNLSFTFPYMHDGRFNTIDEVLDHYERNKVKNQNTELGVLEIRLTKEEKDQLKAFLLTLNGCQKIAMKFE